MLQAVLRRPLACVASLPARRGPAAFGGKAPRGPARSDERAGRGQDAGQLPLSRPGGGGCSRGPRSSTCRASAIARATWPLSCWMTDFRSIRWGRKRARPHCNALPAISPPDGPLGAAPHCRGAAPCRGALRSKPWPTWRGWHGGWWRRVRPVEWEPACLEFHQDASRPIRTASVVQVRQPLYQPLGGPLAELRQRAGGNALRATAGCREDIPEINIDLPFRDHHAKRSITSRAADVPLFSSC